MTRVPFCFRCLLILLLFLWVAAVVDVVAMWVAIVAGTGAVPSAAIIAGW